VLWGDVRARRFAVTAAVICSVSAGAIASSQVAAATPAPVLGQSAVIERVGGHVSYELPGAAHFKKLGEAAVAIPFGTTVSAPAGTVQVTIATTTPGAPISALFYTGQFAISQTPASGIATLTLNGPLAPCAATAATKAPRKPASTPTTRSLWGNGGAGHFQTKGSYAAATVLGTVWLTTDSCSSTVVSVAEGSVGVSNLVNNSSETVSTDQALTVQSSGTTSVAPFSGPTTPPSYGSAIAIRASSTAVTLGTRYSLTASGTAAGAGSAYIYENIGSPCSTTLTAERTNKVADYFGDKALTAAGQFTLTVPALAKHTGTKYYCAYLTNPAAFAQVVVHVSS
jgi:hypothetical protein